MARTTRPEERHPPSATASSTPEACVGCGEGTGAGMVFFSDWRVIERPPGQPLYLCILCDGRIRRSRRGRRLTDDEVSRLVEGGSLAYQFWGAHG